MKRQTIGIVGGKGLMGGFFRSVFKKKGFRVLVSDLKTKETNQSLIKKSDIVLFSVPIHVTQNVIAEVLPWVRKDQLLLDCTSLKTFPVRMMLKSPAQVIGLHPMFRPSSLGLRKQTVVLCPARADTQTRKEVRGWFTSEGAHVVTMTPREHDRLMSIIQVLIHFHTLALGHTLRKLKVPLRKTLQVASPIYRLEMDMIGRIFSQNPHLYGSIEMLNPETKRVTSALIEEIEMLAKIISKKDMAAFTQHFKRTAAFLGNFKEKALREINKLLPHVG